CGSLVIVAVGYLAKEMGGKGFAVSVAAVAAFARTAPGFHKYSMNFIEHLFLLALFFIILRIIKTQNPKYWLLFGIVAGVGLQNKISILFFSFGIIVGLIATPMRRHLKSAYLWGGVAIAGLLFAPYVIWNAVNGWPTREFIETARAVKMTAVTPLEFLVKQIFEANPL
ncbi:MAG: glycosyltransferase family 39 protein, partial [bacterium]|nr:glycosyltransferase family 39 protein [bacterium]